MENIIITGLKYGRSAKTIMLLCDVYARLMGPANQVEEVQTGNSSRTLPRKKQTLFTLHVSEDTYVAKVNSVFRELVVSCPVCDKRYISAACHFVRVDACPDEGAVVTSDDICISCHACAGDSSEFNRKLLRVDRLKVWLACFGSSLHGECVVCGDPLHLASYHEMGHDISHSHGGTCSVSNLRPVHADCNRRMGTRSFADMLLQRHGHRNLPAMHMTLAEADTLARKLVRPSRYGKSLVCGT